MAKKIILFLSSLTKPTKTALEKGEAKEEEYTGPGGIKVSGFQTNEAPVLYLLEKHPDVSDIICMVTKEAENDSWEHFWNTVQRPGLEYHKIPREVGDNFSDGPMKEILKYVRPGDEVFLETTGGFRDTAMHLMLLTRVLSYTGVNTTEAVYANRSENKDKNKSMNKIVDVSDVIGMFDLVNGMQDLTSFGNVSTLADYYRGRPHDKSIDSLLYTMKALSSDITLCRTDKIENRVEAFNHALSAAEKCKDPLMRELLPVFRKKFGENPDILSLVMWCANNGMIQQALTIYKEKVPRYILRDRPDLLILTHPVENDEYDTAFRERVLDLAKKYPKEEDRPQTWRKGRGWDGVNTLENLDILLSPEGDVMKGSCPTEHIQSILQDYFYLRALRNMICHASDDVMGNKNLMDYLREEYHYKDIKSTTVEDITAALSRAVRHLRTAGTKEWKR